jgi:hypothetical protein
VGLPQEVIGGGKAVRTSFGRIRSKVASMFRR